MNRESMVTMDAVSKRFGSTVALDAVALAVAPGELFGLVGPDGAGKTTVFRILTTLLLPDSGTATVLASDVVADYKSLRRRIGYMPGQFSLYADLSVEENLHFFARVFGADLDRGMELIRPIYRELEPFRDRRAAALSGGMKQKLALCCALVHRPEILFLDEPTTGVDAVARRTFWAVLDDLRSQGLTMLVSTPYMDEAARCDRIALMQGGRILAIDSSDNIGNRFPRPLFAVTSNQRLPLLRALRSLPHTVSALPFGSEIHVSDRRDQLDPLVVAADIGHGLVLAGVDDASVRPISAGIEDVFIELMGSTANNEIAP